MHRLRLLGGTVLRDQADREVAGVVAQPKRLALLAFLALGDREAPTRRDSVLALLWPELDEDRARNALNKSVHLLRQELGSDVVASHGDSALSLDHAAIECDAVLLLEAARASEWDRALELYQGELLPGFILTGAPAFEDWLFAERSRLREVASEAARHVALAAERAARFDRAAAAAKRLTTISPDDERALRFQLELLERIGDRAGALAVYEGFVARLRRDFDAGPSAETIALASRLRERAVADVTRIPAPDTERPTERPAERPAAEGVTLGAASAPPAPDGGRVNPPRHGRTMIVLAAAAAMMALAWRETRSPVIAGSESMAVMPFVSVDGDSALMRLSQNLVTLVSASLDGVGALAITDPVAVLGRARPERGPLSVATAAALGRDLGARSVVTGTLTSLGGDVRADVALYAVDDVASPLFRFSRRVRRDSVAALSDTIVWGILREIWRTGAPTPFISSIDTRLPEALRHYLDGEQWFAAGRMNEASAEFATAASLDTTFLFAHFRHVVARNWVARRNDSAVVHRLRRDVAQLPTREREIVEAFLFIGIGDFTTRLLFGRAVAERNPDHMPSLLIAGDFGAHQAPLVGAEAADALPQLQRIVALAPGDITMAEHLATLCAVIGDSDCAERAFTRLDSLVRVEPDVTRHPRGPVRNLAFLLRGSPATRDSFVRLVRADSLVPNHGFGLQLFGAMFARRPSALVEWDSLLTAIVAGRGPMAEFSRERLLFGRAFRGDSGAVDSLRSLYARPSRRPTEDERRGLLRVEFLQELQGLRAASASTAREALTLAASPEAWIVDSVEGIWIAAVNAMLRGDSTGVRARQRELGRFEHHLGVLASRSLRAVGQGFAGQTAAAAESLLVVERRVGDMLGPMVWTIAAADRILGAEWLSKAGRHAPADSLLRFTRAYSVFGEVREVAIQPVYATANFLRSRIAEDLGQRERAIEFARIFLVMSDRAKGAKVQARIEEARERIRLMGGSVDGEAVRPVPR